MATIERNDISLFYDDFSARLIRDYVKGNRRIEAAIDLACGVIGKCGAVRVLDVGCGIGTTSDAFASHNRDAFVHGVDISPVNINIAQSLFPSERLHFSVSDLSSPPDDQQYSIAVMIDVYEHIPLNQRGRFSAAVARCLTDDGVVVLTTPSRLHQEYLEQHDPNGLQIVDETISLQDVVELAGAVGGEVTKYEWVSIWNTNDYIHVVIERKPRYETVKSVERKSSFRRFMATRRRRAAIRMRRHFVNKAIRREV